MTAVSHPSGSTTCPARQRGTGLDGHDHSDPGQTPPSTPDLAHDPASRVSVVLLTYNRVDEVMRSLDALRTLCRHSPVIVVDNGSSDGTAERIAQQYPEVTLVALPDNRGAAGRNAGVARVTTDYVAFCDDDTWWGPGSLAKAAELLDAHPHVAILSSRIVVGPEEKEDDTCRLMAVSPLPADGLPGPALIGYMAGASVHRVCAFREVGGYCPRLFIGGEEELVALDLLSAGWSIAYAPMLRVHHHPSVWRDGPRRLRLLARNAAWVALMRLPLRAALRRMLRAVRVMAREKVLWRGLADMLRGLPWALRQRRPVPQRVLGMLDCVARSESAAIAPGALPVEAPAAAGKAQVSR